tara:strand:+ start:1107 stop:2198 length:1092 start_codon:yes stop_codon:yes gene_type:complete
MKPLVPKPGILEIKPYVSGESRIQGIEHVIKLSSNESALGASAEAVSAYNAVKNGLHLYPDGNAVELREAIGVQHGLDPSRIICGAGSDELFYNLARAYASVGDEIIYSKHGFNIYPIVARTVGATPVVAPETSLTFNVDAVLSKVTSNTKIVFIANPNNPTGSYISENELYRLRRDLPEDILFVVDGAYAEYVTQDDYSDGISLVDASENTVMTRTFSKIYGLAALRIGWGYCPPSIADVLNRLRAPFNLTVAAQHAGVAALNDTAHISASRCHNAVWLPWLSNRLKELGLTVHPSVANFILVQFSELKGKQSSDAYNFLAQHGILTRKTTGYGLPDCLRITIGREDEVKAVATMLSEFVSR